MNTVSQLTTWPDEADTKKTDYVSTKMVAFAHRTDRLVELALERLRTGGEHSIADACMTLVQLQELAGQVLR